MNVPLWAAELADVFWAAAGLPEPFPRSFLPAIRRGWPINLIPASGLRLHTVREWVVQNHFGDYQVVRMPEAPTVDVHIIPSTEAPGGIGEPSTAVIAGALANAIFAATGKRIYSLPVKLA